MRAIFISYRRNDAEGEAGRLFDDLVREFGENSVFMDVAAIEFGRDFRQAIDESVATCGVLLAVIGKEWTEAKNETGQRRLDDPFDFVRLETVSALKRDIPVIPVLVHGARMPRAEQLPDDLKDLAYRNGVELAHTRWNSDLQLLIKALRRHVEEPKDTAGTPNRPQGEAALATKSSVRVSNHTSTNRTAAGTSPAPAKKPFGIIPAVVGAVLLVGIVVAYMIMPKQVTVPDLSGITLSDATAKLEAMHLAAGRRSFQQDTTKDPNIVLNQSPAPNQQVKSGTTVDLVLSQRPVMVEIPWLAGKSLDAAEQALQDRHLNVGNISREPKSDVTRNTVLDEFPKAGKRVDPGTAVDLVVSDASGGMNAPHSPATANPPNATTSAQRVSPHTGFRVIEALLRADPFNYTGPCPVTIKFSGRVSAIGGSGNVSYKFLRSDSANAPVQTLTFSSPGSKDINETWRLGSPPGRSYSGWEAIQVLEPQEIKSEEAHFNIHCQ